jgi:anthranilate phosphoribosyltransferase
VVDTCGTGGDGLGCFNVSTAAGFVVAGAGFSVAKHGNRSVSSRCGSADVLEAAGISIQLDAAAAERALSEVGFTFLFAPAFHPAMKHAMPVRKELGVRTIFNLLGPLTNPAKPNVQVLGVYEDRWVRPVADVLVELGCTEGVVVHGQGQDEITLSGPTHAAEILAGKVEEHEWRPEDFGITSQPLERVLGGDASRNVEILLSVLRAEASPYRDSVCLNAAAAIRAAARMRSKDRQQLSLKDAYRSALESLTSGKAMEKFERLRSLGGAKAG